MYGREERLVINITDWGYTARKGEKKDDIKNKDRMGFFRYLGLRSLPYSDIFTYIYVT